MHGQDKFAFVSGMKEKKSKDLSFYPKRVTVVDTLWRTIPDQVAIVSFLSIHLKNQESLAKVFSSKNNCCLTLLSSK